MDLVKCCGCSADSNMLQVIPNILMTSMIIGECGFYDGDHVEVFW